MMLFDHHTHNLAAPAGSAVICLPREVVAQPAQFAPRRGALYSVAVHPWWIGDGTETLWQGVETLAAHPQVVAIGETGFDRVRAGEGLAAQYDLFMRHARLSERLAKPLIIHCVRAADILLRAHAEVRPAAEWLVHGFRGKAALARQILDAGIRLSFGPHFNTAALALIAPSERRYETDDSGLTIEEVVRRAEQTMAAFQAD
ncbi:MAG: TatD family hydrolase [Bacteroidaceae bacterium]|nr:TatD family hydrolase [Bacteroidaceae bacterium]